MKRIYTTEVFRRWFRALQDRQARRRIQARLELHGHCGDCKPVASGVFEMRIHCGPGYRVYYMQRGNEIIVLLVGGNKASQKRDIARATELAREVNGNDEGIRD
ncbi:MAG: type II toxin-antitoxin system RelE/ParE family toxin [Gammaproteobacteria bacterium]|nr:MAG: type II toxin-antitoxin system RelE/ParE family toxin [Gammaproteobacteria bacterium]